MPFSNEDITQLTKAVAGAIMPLVERKLEAVTPTPAPQESMHQYASPVLEEAEQVELETIKAMPDGVKIVVTKRGTQQVNYSQIKLNTLKKWKENRNQNGETKYL